MCGTALESAPRELPTHGLWRNTCCRPGRLNIHQQVKGSAFADLNLLQTWENMGELRYSNYNLASDDCGDFGVYLSPHQMNGLRVQLTKIP